MLTQTNPQLHAGTQRHCTTQNWLTNTSQKIAVGVTWAHLGAKEDKEGWEWEDIYWNIANIVPRVSPRLLLLRPRRISCKREQPIHNPSCTSSQPSPHTAPRAESSLATKSNTRAKRKRSIWTLHEGELVFPLTLQITQNFLWLMSLTRRVLTLQSTFISLQDKVISSQWEFVKNEEIPERRQNENPIWFMTVALTTLSQSHDNEEQLAAPFTILYLAICTEGVISFIYFISH